MPVLSAYCAGVSTTGIELITDAVTQVFGECSVDELGRDNLRYKVRLGSKDTSVVLVILDNTSMEECKDIEDGLYNSDKFYNYTDDIKLVDFLNNVFGLSLEYPEDMLSVSSDVSTTNSVSFQEFEDDKANLVEMYSSQLQDKDNIIRTLNFTIKELQGIISEEGYEESNKELEVVKNENLELKSRINDLLTSIESLKDTIKGKEGTEASLKENIRVLEEKVQKADSLYKSVNKELSEERVTSSQKSGVIRDKEKEILKLTAQLAETISLGKDNEVLKDTVSNLEKTVKKLQSTINNLNIDVSSKNSEIERLKSDIATTGRYNAQIEKYKDLLEKSESNRSDMEKKYSDLYSDYQDVVEKHNALIDDLDEYDRKYEELEEKYKESQGYLAKANSDKIAIEEKLRVLETSTDRDVNIESTMTELSELRKKYTELQMNVFNVISTKSLPHSGVKVPLIKGVLNKFKSIRFQFSGNSESRKGTYKCMYNEFMGMPNEKFLIIDVTSETAIDYVFQMRSIVDGMPWFATGGGVQKYISSTCLPNVKVLMPKIGYVNDSYYLTVNWEKRLQELENSGYKVVVYCGDISNLVSRVLFETFSQIGNTAVYVHGNALGSRSVIANASGLTGIKSSLIAYYDFDKNVSKFFDIMSKKCKCKIISYAKAL